MKTDAKNFVVKIMRIKDEEGQTVKTKEDDSNKLLIDDVSGDEALSFWSRIAARHAYSQAKDCHLIILLIVPTYIYLFAHCMPLILL